jgi:hypothetical protein
MLRIKQVLLFTPLFVTASFSFSCSTNSFPTPDTSNETPTPSKASHHLRRTETAHRILVLPVSSPAGPTTMATSQQEDMAVVGIFSRTFGDPPPGGDGKPRYSYSLWTETGEDIRLVFDEDVYWPARGFWAFNRQRVLVEGVLRPDGSLLVKRMELR